MRMRHIGGVAAVLLAVQTALPAQAPSFTGTWKINLEKSQLTGQTVSFEKKPAGLMHFDTRGFGYDFDATGKEYPMPDGGTTSWKQVNPTTWETTNRANGKVIASYRTVIDGDSMDRVIKDSATDGKSMETHIKWARVSGGPGLVGKWKSSEFKGTAATMQLAVDGSAAITMKVPAFQMACTGRFDGKDYPVSVGGAAVKQTMAFERKSPTAIKMTSKLDGKLLYTDLMTLSADGNTLVDDTMPASVNEPSKAVYERQ